MRSGPGIALLASLTAAAPAAAQQLSYVERVEMRSVPAPEPPQNPLAASLLDRLHAIVAGRFAASLNGPQEISATLSAEGLRLEHLSGGPPELQRKIVIVRPDGQTFVLDAATREYWGFRAASGGAASTPTPPDITAVHTGETVDIAGTRSDRVTFAVNFSSTSFTMFRSMTGAEVSLGGEVWIAPALRQYGELLATVYRSSELAAFGSAVQLQKDGFVMRMTLHGDLLNGHELERVVTQLKEGPVTSDAYVVPANYHAVPPPAPPGDRPSVLEGVKATYTQEAMQQKIQGTVRLQLTVEGDGSVDDVRVVRSLDTQYGLDDQAVAAVRQWKFNPAHLYGRPAATVVVVELEFKLK
jgi:TonB family protein